MLSIISIQQVTLNSNIIKCWETIDTDSTNIAISRINELEKEYQGCDLDFYLANGNWEHVDFWPHSRSSISNEHIKVLNGYNK